MEKTPHCHFPSWFQVSTAALSSSTANTRREKAYKPINQRKLGPADAKTPLKTTLSILSLANLTFFASTLLSTVPINPPGTETNTVD